jgi:hypothetical protein
VIEPYDQMMADLAKEWRAVWGLRVWGSILSRHQNADRQIYVYAGKDYAQPIRRAGFHQATFHEPLAGKMLGERLSWLKQEIATSAPRVDPT